MSEAMAALVRDRIISTSAGRYSAGDEAIDRFRSARIAVFVPVLVERAARDTLRERAGAHA